MEALLAATAAAEKQVVDEQSPDESGDTPDGKGYSRKTRPTHTAYQKAVMTRCTLGAGFRSGTLPQTMRS